MCQELRMVAAIALATAVGCGGDDDSTTPVGPSGPANRAPQTSQSIPDQTVSVGSEERFDLQSHFRDPDGDALSYAATTSNAQVATVGVSASVVTVRAVSLGRADVTVTAVDPGGLTATQTFGVTGEQPPNRAPQVSASLPDRTLTLDEDHQSGFVLQRSGRRRADLYGFLQQHARSDGSSVGRRRHGGGEASRPGQHPGHR